MLTFFFWLSLSLAPLYSEIHDIHLSKADVNYNEENQSIEISLHIFIDDLEMAIRMENPEELLLATSQEHRQANTFIEAYIKDHFMIEVNGVQIDFNFIGKEESNDLLAFWCYFEATKITSLHSLKFTNSLMTELYRDQKNIIALTTPSLRKFYMLDESNTEEVVDLSP